MCVTLKCDGLRAYRTFIERHVKLEITPVSCLTHITRKFKEARHEHPRIAARILLLTGSIYQIEKQWGSVDPLPRFTKPSRPRRRVPCVNASGCNGGPNKAVG
jgi:hypothetical protein